MEAALRRRSEPPYLTEANASITSRPDASEMNLTHATKMVTTQPQSVCNPE